MDLDDALESFGAVGRAFEELGISYQLGGSVASTIHGFPRGTLDVDVAVDLKEEHILPLVAKLEKEWLITPEMMWEAIQYRSSFNLIPFDAIAKVDVFVSENRPFDLSARSRRLHNLAMANGSVLPFYVDSAEDTILRKLLWYQMGGYVAEQKWLDVLGVLKAKIFDIDTEYLTKWAQELGVSVLLEKAFDESGLTAME